MRSKLLAGRNWLKDMCSQNSTKEIAELLGCNAKTVTRWKKRHGIKDRSIRRSPFVELNDPGWLRREYERKSATQIAYELHCSRITVYEWLKKHNIACRSTSTQLRYPKLADKDWFTAKHNEGMPQSDIARELGCTRACVSLWAKRHGLKWLKRQSWYINLRDPQWLREMCDKKSTNEIAQLLGCCTGTVRYWKRKYGISSRSISGSRFARLNDPEWLRQQYGRESIMQIAIGLGCHYFTVYAWLKKHNIARRPVGRRL